MTSIRVPSRARSSSTLIRPTSSSPSSFPSSPSSPSPSSSSPTFSSSLSSAELSARSRSRKISTRSLTASQLTSSSSSTNTSRSITVQAVRQPKLRRPSLPIMSASTSHIPTLGALPHHHYLSQQHLIKEISTLRSARTSASENNIRYETSSTTSLSSSHIARPSSGHSSTRNFSMSPSSRSGTFSTGRLGDSSNTAHSKPTSSPSVSGSANASVTSPSLIAKPVARTQKSSAIKPPSIVTKPNSGNSHQHLGATAAAALSTTTAQKNSSSHSSLPPIAPSSPKPLSAHTPQTASSGTFSSSPFTTPLGIATSASASSSSLQTFSSSPSSPSTSASSIVRSKNRLHAGVDSACYMMRSGSSESFVSSACSSASSTPTMSAVSTMAALTGAAMVSVSGSSTPGSHQGTLIPVYQQRKPVSIRPTAADLRAATTATFSSISSSPSIPTSHATIPTPATSNTTVSHSNCASLPLIKDISAPRKLNDPLHTYKQSISKMTTTFAATARCQCPPPLEFPENVKREMAREEAEHRHRECDLYSKIIELQIENDNLKGEKETLLKIVSCRDRMLVELRTQLQVMEYVCRENDIKVDIELFPDEAIQNWSFEESDEVYQRILLTMQDLLRVGSKCVEENAAMSRSSSQRRRSSRSMSISSASKTLSDHGRGVQLSMVQGQEADSLLPKETSRPGTLKFDTHNLLRSEQELHGVSSNNSTLIVSHMNLAEIDANVERNGRRALDRGDDRSSLFQTSAENYHYRSEDDDSADSDMIDDDDDEGQESEFEELGEDMIKYVELQSCVAPPRRATRSSSVSKILGSSYGSSGSAAGTPEMSTAVLMKNLWNSSGARRSAATTPLQHPFHNPQQHYSQAHQGHGRATNRSSSESYRSNNSAMEDYFTRGQRHSMESNSSAHPPHTGAAASPGIGLGLIGVGRSLDQISMERFLVAPPTCALPPSPLPYSIPYYPSSSGSLNRSPLSGSSSATFPSYGMNMMDCGIAPPPPMMPLPPLPNSPKFSYREHTKNKLLESKRPTHGRTSSHGFVIENVGQFLKRKTYSKTLDRDWVHRGQRRRDSV